MQFCTADYVIGILTAAAAVCGIFIGFSGALAFLVGLVVSALIGKFGWGLSVAYLSAGWSRALATVVVSLLGFGLSRLVVKKCVHGLVAQPADALLGALLAALSCAGLSLTALWFLNQYGWADISSRVLTLVVGQLGLAAPFKAL